MPGGAGAGHQSASLWGDRLIVPRNYEECASVFIAWFDCAGKHQSGLELPMNFLGQCLPVSTVGHAHSTVLTGQLTSSPKAAHLKLESECESKAVLEMRRSHTGRWQARRPQNLPSASFRTLTMAEVCRHTGHTPSSTMGTHFMFPCFTRNCLSELVELIILSPKGFACYFLFLSQLILCLPD